MAECWKPVSGYEGYYEISSLGRVRRIAGGMRGARAGRLLKPFSCGDGNQAYPGVKLYRDNIGKTFLLHLLVYDAFRPGKRDGQRRGINHKDLNKFNPRLSNLETMTQIQNVHHAMARGRKGGRQGEDHPKAIVTEEQVRYIRKNYVPYKFSRVKLAAMFGISVAGIKQILNHRNWKGVI